MPRAIALRGDEPAMKLRDAPGNRQADAESLTGVRRSRERLENAFEILWRDADALVADDDMNRAVAGDRAALHASTRERVSQRVVNEIRDELTELGGTPLDRLRLMPSRQAAIDLPRRRFCLAAVERFAYDVSDVVVQSRWSDTRDMLRVRSLLRVPPRAEDVRRADAPRQHERSFS